MRASSNTGIACQLANVGIEVLLMDMVPKEAGMDTILCIGDEIVLSGRR